MNAIVVHPKKWDVIKLFILMVSLIHTTQWDRIDFSYCVTVAILGRTKLNICFWSTHPSQIDQATKLFILNFILNLSSS